MAKCLELHGDECECVASLRDEVWLHSRHLLPSHTEDLQPHVLPVPDGGEQGRQMVRAEAGPHQAEALQPHSRLGEEDGWHGGHLEVSETEVAQSEVCTCSDFAEEVDQLFASQFTVLHVQSLQPQHRPDQDVSGQQGEILTSHM